MFRHKIGSHVPRKNPLNEASIRNAEVIQINVSAPRNWFAPKHQGDEKLLIENKIPIFIHAPYLINPSSVNPEIRLKSRLCLQQESDMGAEIQAKGIIVHGGHPTGEGNVSDAISGWLKTLDGIHTPCRILIENTAGGTNSPARTATNTIKLITELRNEGHDIGFVFDTCHAWASGENPTTMIVEIKEALSANSVGDGGR